MSPVFAGLCLINTYLCGLIFDGGILLPPPIIIHFDMKCCLF